MLCKERLFSRSANTPSDLAIVGSLRLLVLLNAPRHDMDMEEARAPPPQPTPGPEQPTARSAHGQDNDKVAQDRKAVRRPSKEYGLLRLTLTFCYAELIGSVSKQLNRDRWGSSWIWRRFPDGEYVGHKVGLKMVSVLRCVSTPPDLEY